MYCDHPTFKTTRQAYADSYYFAVPTKLLLNLPNIKVCPTPSCIVHMITVNNFAAMENTIYKFY